MTDRQITHGPGCWDWGPRHYECALQEIKLLVAEWERVFAAKSEAEARAERLAEALRRYRNEVPLGHQPHMLAHEVDDLLRDQESE